MLAKSEIRNWTPRKPKAGKNIEGRKMEAETDFPEPAGPACSLSSFSCPQSSCQPLRETTPNLRKYQTPNPVVQCFIRRFFRRLLKEITKVRPATILDLGCGEGIVAGAIMTEMPGIAYRGCDRNSAAIDEARRRNPTGRFECKDLFDLHPESQRADLLLCLEVMEHIEDTDRLLKQIARLAGKHVIVSVPWEPFFRLGNLCRGLYVRRLGNHPEHMLCFGRASFRKALSRHFEEVRVESSFPWLLGICSPRMNANGRE